MTRAGASCKSGPCSTWANTCAPASGPPAVSASHVFLSSLVPASNSHHMLSLQCYTLPPTHSHTLTVIFQQRDARPAVEAAPALDRRREEGRRLHGPAPGRPEQSRGGCRAVGSRRQGRPRPAERQSTDGPSSSRRAPAHADRSGEYTIGIFYDG